MIHNLQETKKNKLKKFIKQFAQMGVLHNLPISHTESIMETCNVVPTFESVDKILGRGHSNET